MPIKREPTPYEIAKAFYGLPHKDRHWKEVMENSLDVSYSRAAQIKYTKLLENHEDEKKLVKHTILQENEKYLPRDTALEVEICVKFGLRSVIVVDSASILFTENPSDRIHQEIGVWGGRMISTSLRPDDIIGIGGGRCLYHSAMNTHVAPGARHRGGVMSLTGLIGPGELNQDIDADHVASFLYAKLQSKGPLKLLTNHIADFGKRYANRKVDTKEVTVAIIGIGSLDEGHRWKQFAKSEGLQGVRDLLGEINELSTSIEAESKAQGVHSYHPVGDFCNWSFLVEPPPINIKSSDLQKLNRLLEKLNKKMLTTTPDEFSKIASRGVVIAVAGGSNKADAIAQILKMGKGKPWITHLVTDTQVAHKALTV